jgi:hypothetical protein
MYFLDIKGIIRFEFVSEGKTVNKILYMLRWVRR